MPTSSSVVDWTPIELWSLVFQSVSRSNRVKIARVNRLFYNIIIPDLYRHVNVVDITICNQVFQTLRSVGLFLSRTPHIFYDKDRVNPELAKLVDSMTLCDVVFYAYLPGKTTTKASGHRPKPSEIFAILHDIPLRQSHSTTSAGLSIEPPLHVASSSANPDTLALFRAVLPSLENIRHLILNSQTLAGARAPSISGELAINIWTAVGANLRSLTLDMSMDKLGEIMRITPRQLSALQELHISVHPRHDHESAQEYKLLLASAVVPFVNHLVPQLTVFSFKAICMVFELDPFFRGVEPTPRLQRLNLCLGWPHHRRKWSLESLEVFLRGRNMGEVVDVKYEKCWCLRDMRGGKCIVQ